MKRCKGFNLRHAPYSRQEPPLPRTNSNSSTQAFFSGARTSSSHTNIANPSFSGARISSSPPETTSLQGRLPPCLYARHACLRDACLRRACHMPHMLSSHVASRVVPIFAPPTSRRLRKRPAVFRTHTPVQPHLPGPAGPGLAAYRSLSAHEARSVWALGLARRLQQPPSAGLSYATSNCMTLPTAGR